MKHIRDLVGNKLVWIEAKGKRKYNILESEGDVLATLTWVKLFGSLAEVENSEGKFTLKSSGVIYPLITIRKLPFNNEIAKLQITKSWNGTLEFNDGWKFTMKKLSLINNNWGFSDMNGRLICTIKQKSWFFRQSAEVLLEVDAKREPRLPLIAIIAWFVLIQYNKMVVAGGSILPH